MKMVKRPLEFVCRIVVFLKTCPCSCLPKYAFFEDGSFHYALHCALELDTGSDLEIRCVSIMLQ